MVVKDRTLRGRLFDYANLTLMFLLALSCVLPMIHVIAVSLSDKESVMLGKVGLWPVNFNLMSYRVIMGFKLFYMGMWNSFLRVIVGTVVNMLCIVITAYPLSREPEELRGKYFFIYYMIFTMLFGGGLIPTYLLIKKLGLINNFWVLILPGAINVFNIIVMMNFFKSLPKSLYESAVIDGAGHFTILFKIYIPLSKAAFATLTLFSIVGHWNAWFDALIYMTDPMKWPVQASLRSLLATQRIESMYVREEYLMRLLDKETLSAAFIVLIILPIVLIYPFIQKHFAAGIVLGSVKE